MVFGFFMWIVGAAAVPETASTVTVRAPRHLRAPTSYEFPVEELHTDPLGSPGRALSGHPAVHGRESGNGTAEWILRAQDPIQNRFFLEGIPLATSLYQRSEMGPLPWEAIGRVDVHAGGIPAALGEGGLGGAVHLRLSEPRGVTGLRASAAEARFHGGWRGAISGHGEVRFGSGAFPYWDDGGTPLVAGDDGMSLRTNNGFVQGTWLPQWRSGATRAFGLVHFARKRIPGPVNLPRPGQLEQGEGVVAVERRWTPRLLSRVHARLGRSRWTSEAAFPSSIPAEVRTLTGGHQLHYSHRGWSGGFSVVGEKFWTDSVARQSLRVPFHAQGQLLGVVRPAVLLTYATQTSGADQVSDWGISPRLTARWRVHPRWQVRASVARVFRIPSLGERFGAPPFQAPNPALSPERAWRAEMGVDGDVGGAAGRHRFSATAFGQWSRDLVTFEQNAQRESLPVNVGRSRVLGVEAAWSGAWKRWQLQSGATLWITENQTATPFWRGRRLPHRPVGSWKSQVQWSRGQWALQYRLSVVGGSFRDLANYRWSGGYALHSAQVVLDSSWGQWALEGRNLSNVITVDAQLGAFQSQNFAGGYLGYPTPGRQVFLTWRKLL